MQPIDLLVACRWVVPVEPEGVVLEHHAIAVDQGRIVAVEPTETARARFDPRTVIERPGHVALPGFVNAHTHAAMSLFRGLADDLELMEWLRQHIWPAEARHVGEDFVRTGTELAVAEMLRGGTTCFNDMYFYPDVAGRVAAEAGMRAVVGLIVIDAPTIWANDIDEYLAKATRVHDQLRAEPLVTTAFAPHAPYTVTDRALERVGVLAEELDVSIHMHVHEVAGEVEDAVAASGERPLARLERLGLLSARLNAVHMTQLVDAELETVKRHGVHVVHCPESNLKLASGHCRTVELLARGVNVALGTDGAASNNDLDMLGEMRSAALLAKSVYGHPTALPAAQALTLATLGGARALGLGEQLGSLLPGKEADLITVDLMRPETQPVYHPLSQLVYAASREQVTDVFVAGRHVLRERTLRGLDLGATLERVERWRSRIERSDAEGGAPS